MRKVKATGLEKAHVQMSGVAKALVRNVVSIRPFPTLPILRSLLATGLLDVSATRRRRVRFVLSALSLVFRESTVVFPFDGKVCIGQYDGKIMSSRYSESVFNREIMRPSSVG